MSKVIYERIIIKKVLAVIYERITINQFLKLVYFNVNNSQYYLDIKIALFQRSKEIQSNIIAVPLRYLYCV